MKLEPRGKYAGVKIHLDGPEVQELIDAASGQMDFQLTNMGETFIKKFNKKVKLLMEEHPKLLEERTPEEIHKELIHEAKSAEAKLKAIKDGIDWKKVKVEVSYDKALA